MCLSKFSFYHFAPNKENNTFKENAILKLTIFEEMKHISVPFQTNLHLLGYVEPRKQETIFLLCQVQMFTVF
jgi:hypothetical protein